MFEEWSGISEKWSVGRVLILKNILNGYVCNGQIVDCQSQTVNY